MYLFIRYGIHCSTVQCTASTRLEPTVGPVGPSLARPLPLPLPIQSLVQCRKLLLWCTVTSSYSYAEGFHQHTWPRSSFFTPADGRATRVASCWPGLFWSGLVWSAASQGTASVAGTMTPASTPRSSGRAAVATRTESSVSVGEKTRLTAAESGRSQVGGCSPQTSVSCAADLALCCVKNDDV